MTKSFRFQIVGGDAHIAPQKTAAVFWDFRRIRNICERADVGIGPYQV